MLFLTRVVSSPGEVLELKIPVEVEASEVVSGVVMLSSESPRREGKGGRGVGDERRDELSVRAVAGGDRGEEEEEERDLAGSRGCCVRQGSGRVCLGSQ